MCLVRLVSNIWAALFHFLQVVKNKCSGPTSWCCRPFWVWLHKWHCLPEGVGWPCTVGGSPKVWDGRVQWVALTDCSFPPAPLIIWHRTKVFGEFNISRADDFLQIRSHGFVTAKCFSLALQWSPPMRNSLPILNLLILGSANPFQTQNLITCHVSSLQFCYVSKE